MEIYDVLHLHFHQSAQLHVLHSDRFPFHAAQKPKAASQISLVLNFLGSAGVTGSKPPVSYYFLFPPQIQIIHVVA